MFGHQTGISLIQRTGYILTTTTLWMFRMEASGSHLKTQSVSVHVWSVHVHKCWYVFCILSMYMYTLYWKKLAVCTESLAGLFFDPLFLFSKTLVLLFAGSRQSTISSWPLPIKLNPMMSNLFLFIISWRSTLLCGALGGLQGWPSCILFHWHFSSSIIPSVPSPWSCTLGLTSNFSVCFFFYLLLTSKSSLSTVMREVSSGWGGEKGTREWFLLSSASGWC